jgi:hypothetical protein
MNPYPWYTINKVTSRLAPCAVYAAGREDFNRLYRPEPDEALIENGHLDAEALEKSVQGDEDRHRWLSDEPIIRDIVHRLMHDPERFTRYAEINAKYMAGFQHEPVFDQARIHMMTACHLMGHWEDDIIAKKWLRLKSLELWSRAWFHGFTQEESSIRRYFPTEEELNAVYSQLPPIRALNENPKGKWPWERVFRSLGLAGVRTARRKKGNSKYPAVFSWKWSQNLRRRIES